LKAILSSNTRQWCAPARKRANLLSCLIFDHDHYGRPLIQMDTLMLVCKKHRQDNTDKNGKLGPDELSRGFLPKRKLACRDFD
jgi:hypothetical protein